jgi:Protein of unknown function (DUF1700)
MTRELYINELKKRLSLLDEAEVNKIIHETDSHIDEQIQAGKDEAAVFEQLGDVNELAKTILKAYKLSDRYIKLFIGKEKVVDEINDFASKVAESSIEVFNKIEDSMKQIFKETLKFGEERIKDVKKIFNRKSESNDEAKNEME